MRSPCTAMKSSPRSPQLEKAHAQQRRPNVAKKKKKKKEDIVKKNDWIQLILFVPWIQVFPGFCKNQSLYCENSDTEIVSLTPSSSHHLRLKILKDYLWLLHISLWNQSCLKLEVSKDFKARDLGGGVCLVLGPGTELLIWFLSSESILYFPVPVPDFLPVPETSWSFSSSPGTTVHAKLPTPVLGIKLLLTRSPWCLILDSLCYRDPLVINKFSGCPLLELHETN